jgi:hypothetical protein
LVWSVLKTRVLVWSVLNSRAHISLFSIPGHSLLCTYTTTPTSTGITALTSTTTLTYTGTTALTSTGTTTALTSTKARATTPAQRGHVSPDHPCGLDCSLLQAECGVRCAAAVNSHLGTNLPTCVTKYRSTHSRKKYTPSERAPSKKCDRRSSEYLSEYPGIENRE